MYPTQRRLMGLPHKNEKYLSIFYWLAPAYCSLQAHASFLSNLSDCDYAARTCICVELNFLTVTGLAIVMKLACVCVVHVTLSECAENSFITEESTALSNRKNVRGVGWEYICNCSTRIFGMQPVNLCRLFWVLSILKSAPFPVAGSFTATAWIWNVAIYTVYRR
jgi:hypothetical protein